MVAWLLTKRELWIKLILLVASGWFFWGARIWPPPPRPIMNLLARNYTVQILPDGDVSVVEHWEVRLDNNPIPHLYFGIYSAHCTDISFGAIQNAQHQTEQLITSDGYAAERVEWFFEPIYRGIVTFDIPYILHGALGMNQQQAWLDWHFLGEDFSPLLKGSTFTSIVSITFPTSVAAADQHIDVNFPGITPSVVALDGHTRQVRAFKLGTGHFLEVESIFPRAALAASVKSPAWQTIAQPSTLPTAPIVSVTQIDNWTWMVVLGLAALFLLFIAATWPYEAATIDARCDHKYTYLGKVFWGGLAKTSAAFAKEHRRPLPPHIIQPRKPKEMAVSRTRPHRHTHRQHLSGE